MSGEPQGAMGPPTPADEAPYNPAADPFWIEHSARSDGVINVYAYNVETGDERTGIFSTMVRAQAWVNSLDEAWTTVSTPFILDEPDYGNIPKGEQQ